MSDAVIAAILVAIPPTLAAVAALIVSINNARGIEGVKKVANGMVDRLVEAERRAALAEGRQLERAQRHEREQTADRTAPPP